MARMNFLDRCIAAVSPVRAVKRAAARTALEFANSGYGNYGANLYKNVPGEYGLHLFEAAGDYFSL